MLNLNILTSTRIAKKTLGVALIGGALFSYSVMSYAATFAGKFEGELTPTSETSMTVKGVGKVTQGGKATNAGIATVLNTSGNCMNVDNKHVITVANGDIINISSLHLSCPIADGAFQGTGTFKIIGGTGKFSNATGTGTFNCEGNFKQGQFSFKFLNGTINLK